MHVSLFFFSFLAPNVTVPVVLWAEACPFASSSTAVHVHHGTECFHVYKNSNLFLKNGGGWANGYFWGRTVLGVMPPVYVQGPVCPDHVAASAWLPVSWLCRFGCPPVQWCPVGEESSMCRLHSWAVDDYPKYTWDGLTLNLFCSITFISKGYT